MAADPEFDGPIPKPQPQPRRGPSLIEILVALAVVAILVALVAPVTRTARPAAQRSQCVNNLKQIALALYNYEINYGALPPAYTVDASGRPLHSWRTLILPYLELPDLYKSIDLTKPWDDPANAKALQAMPSAYRCPAADGPASTTTYLAIVGPQNAFLPDKPRRLAEITNDHGKTLMVIEADEASAVPWMAPRDADEALVLGIGPKSRLAHNGGVNAAFVDGRVDFLKASTPAEERREMLAISGHETKARGADSPSQGPAKVD